MVEQLNSDWWRSWRHATVLMCLGMFWAGVWVPEYQIVIMGIIGGMYGLAINAANRRFYDGVTAPKDR